MLLLAGGEVDAARSVLRGDAGAADEDDGRAVGRPVGLELVEVGGGDLLECAGGDVDGPDVVGAFEGAVGGEGDGLAVGRDAGLAVVAVAVGDLLEAGAVGLHGPDVKGAAGVGLDGDEVAFGGPVGVRGFVERPVMLLGVAAG